MARRKKDEVIIDEYDEEYEDDSEALNVWDAALIWMSNGMDEDYMFGYTESELRAAAGL